MSNAKAKFDQKDCMYKMLLREVTDETRRSLLLEQSMERTKEHAKEHCVKQLAQLVESKKSTVQDLTEESATAKKDRRAYKEMVWKIEEDKKLIMHKMK